MLVEQAVSPVAIEKIATVIAKIFTLPYLSANVPKMIPPASIPRLVMVDIAPPAVELIAKSAIIEVST